MGQSSAGGPCSEFDKPRPKTLFLLLLVKKSPRLSRNCTLSHTALNNCTEEPRKSKLLQLKTVAIWSSFVALNCVNALWWFVSRELFLCRKAKDSKESLLSRQCSCCTNTGTLSRRMTCIYSGIQKANRVFNYL